MAPDDIKEAVEKGMQPFVDKLAQHESDDIEKFSRGEAQFTILHEAIGRVEKNHLETMTSLEKMKIIVDEHKTYVSEAKGVAKFLGFVAVVLTIVTFYLAVKK